MPHVSRRAFLAGSAAVTLLPQRGRAEDATIKIVFPFSAGGAGDVLARLIAEHLQKQMSRPVIVDNRTGAGGALGAVAVKNAPADGTMLLLAGASQLTLQPHISTNLGYDPFADLVPVALAVSFDQALAVANTVPARSVKELVDWLRANPEKATYGSPGAGTIPYFAGTELARLGKIELRHVAYRGSSAAMPDLVTGRISAYIAAIADLIEQHKSGGIRILAVPGNQRSEFLPDIPTMKESGFDIDTPGWFGFYAPARTSEAEIAHLGREIATAIQMPDVKAKILSLGYTPTPILAAELGALQRVQYERWREIVKSSGYQSPQ